MNSSVPKMFYGILLFNFWWMYKYLVNNEGTLHPLILIILMFLFAIQNYLSDKNNN